MALQDMDKLVSLCKRRGFIFPSSEIYGGLGSTWDYGPLGVELKRNIRDAWWRATVQERDDMVGLDAAILMHPQVWEASGHTKSFADPFTACLACGRHYRADTLKDNSCPSCGGELAEPAPASLMLETQLGPVRATAQTVYLRPETAQGIFVNFSNVLTATRRKLPFGIAQIGKAFRNEITPGNFIFRTREFEQMEIEYFVKPGTEDEHFAKWVQARFDWYVNLGIDPDHLRRRPHAADELAHYARACSDIEYLFPMGWSELEGIANRGDYDLRQHAQSSGKELTYFDEESGQHLIPSVIEPSAGVDRSLLAFLADAYTEEEVRGEQRVVLKLHRALAPIKVAVLPLSRNERLLPLAQEAHALLRPHFMTQFDDTQSIGRRYRRQDEAGTPLCVTIDFESLEDRAVTIRERDSMAQMRVPLAALAATLQSFLGKGGQPFDEAHLPAGGRWLGVRG